MDVPEILAPAGSEMCLYAAVESGADAVYFGLAPPHHFNARSRSENFPLDRITKTLRFLHDRSVKGYVALNTLIYYDELIQIEHILETLAESGADAVIVQDFGVARLAKTVCGDLPIHASTQMSLTSVRGIEKAQELGIKRVVLPRELSLKQIQAIRRETDIELECFIHGALCISFSGQCYASAGLGGRSANRGICAQPCRLPYSLLSTEGEITDTKQLLSPCDFSALPLLKDLIAAGVNSLKIEGRLKSADYVAEVTNVYRHAIDTGTYSTQNAGEPFSFFSRGFSTGWLEGVQPHKLVPGNIKSHRGTLLGKVIEVRRDAAVVQLSAPVRRGDGVVFENVQTPEHSQGGRVYEIFRRGQSVKDAEAGAKVLLTFENHSIDATYAAEGQNVRKTDDTKLKRNIHKQWTSPQTKRRMPLNMTVSAVAGEPIHLSVESPFGTTITLTGNSPLEVAKKHPITEDVLREQLDRLGSTIYELGKLKTVIKGNPMIPLSVLGQLRRELIEKLNEMEPPVVERTVQKNALEMLRANAATAGVEPQQRIQHILYRRLPDAPSLQDRITEGCQSFYGEFRSKDEYKTFAESVRSAGAEFVAVLPRIIKPGETKLLHYLAELQPDAVLARNLEELQFFRHIDVPVIADFSFNVINDLSFQQLLDWGTERITLGFDLDEKQTEHLLEHVPAERVEQIISGRVPLFLMEHCLWQANLLREDERCNKMCRTFELSVKDRRGAIHPVRSDYFCRNIIERSGRFEAKPLVEHVRVELD
jgi:putative protease